MWCLQNVYVYKCDVHKMSMYTNLMFTKCLCVQMWCTQNVYQSMFTNVMYTQCEVWVCPIYEYKCNIYETWSITTGWRRLIGSPKLQIIFHKRATKYRALLRKMTYKDKASYESSPPCIECDVCEMWCIIVWYGVATIRRLLKITGLFCKRAL